MGSNNKFGWLQTPATTPQGKSLYPNLSQYAANHAQTVQREQNAVFSFQQFTSEPARNHPFAKPLYGPKPVSRVPHHRKSISLSGYKSKMKATRSGISALWLVPNAGKSNRM